MDASSRIERALNAAVAMAEMPGCPPRLAAAMRYAVFPRRRAYPAAALPGVAGACGEDHPHGRRRRGAAIELLHCASLVHDDLPCFDDAATRRGRPSVHRAFGEPLAVLAGDALIVLAFQTLAQHAAPSPARLDRWSATIGALGRRAPRASSPARPGNARTHIDLSDYQRAKTGALFAAATIAGAAAAGADAGAVARARGEARRGLSGRRRHPRCDRQTPRISASRWDGTWRWAVRMRRNNSAWMARLHRLAELVGGAIEAIPDCPGARSCAR